MGGFSIFAGGKPRCWAQETLRQELLGLRACDELKKNFGNVLEVEIRCFLEWDRI